MSQKTHLLLDLSENSPGGLHLELVNDVALLVDGGPGLLGSRLSILGGSDEDVDSVDLSLLEGLHVLVSSLVGRRVEDDSLGSVGRVLEVLARELA